VRKNGDFTEFQLSYIAKAILSAFKEVHSKNFYLVYLDPMHVMVESISTE
jgi:hypothetical protein